MHRHVVAVFVMLSVVVILVTMHYSIWNIKITWWRLWQQRRLVEENGISVRQAKRLLDTYVYLEEHHWWAPSGLHCQFLLQRMFLHAVAMGWKEYDSAICWGQWELSPEQDLDVEPYAIELICPTLTREGITEIYQDVYQLWRSPGELPAMKRWRSFSIKNLRFH